MWSVIVKHGPMRGASFPLGDLPLSIGRGRQCSVILNEQTVSRIHCEIALRHDGPWLSQLAEENATLVNGMPVRGCALHAGDEVAVGETVLLIAREPSGEAAPRDAQVSGATAQLCLATESSVDVLAQRGRPSTTRDLADLYLFGRHLSACTSRDEAAEAVCAWLTQRLGPRAVRLFLDRDAMAEKPPGNGPDAARALAARCAEGACMSEDGVYLGAPLVLGACCVGAAVLEWDPGQMPLPRALVDLVMAYAVAAAPYLHGLEKRDALENEVRWLRQQPGEHHGLVGSSEAIERLRGLAARAARTNLHVLIHGETGTGKELVAHLLHALSPRGARQLVIVNCAAIPSDLFESELFGHERGAFTGASTARMGRLEQADGGTLFLDEVADLSLANQAKMLRAIETGVFHRVGAERESRVDVRVVAASNKDLREAVARGVFREDLYHRLNGIELHVPPLRERAGDVPLLARHFFAVYAPSAPSPVRGLTEDALARMMAHAWPGNVRELKQCVQRGIQMAAGDWVTADDLFPQARAADTAGGAPQTLQEVEREHIRATLAACGGSISAAAARLGIHRNTLSNKMREYGL